MDYNVPTQLYKDYRGEDAQSKRIMAKAVKSTYVNIFRANEYAYKLDSKFIFKYFKDYSSRNYINEEDYEETYKLVRRWKKYPPTNICNKISARLKGL